MRIPGPTKPTQVLPISSWMSPWFHAKPPVTHSVNGTLLTVHGFEAWKKKQLGPESVQPKRIRYKKLTH